MRTVSLLCAGSRDVAELAAEIVANRLAARQGMRLLLPTGHTPLPVYAALRQRREAGALEGSADVFQLDEYVGLEPEDPRSYRAYLARELAGSGLRLSAGLDGTAADPALECARYQDLLDQAPIDLAVLGLGRNGHVAFNEPGSLPGDGVRTIILSEGTREAAAPDFGSLESVPTHAFTVGLRTLLEARELLVLVTGEVKAEALAAMFDGPPRSAFPASLLRMHPHLTVLCDQEAAARLRPRAGTGSDHVVIVLGHRERPAGRLHRATHESAERVRVAEGVVGRDPARAAILTGHTSTPGDSSEAEQMAAEWTSDVPVVLELAGRNTAENATRSLPLILALGGVRRVTVVTSAWHIRARPYFAPYRRYGLELRFRYDWRGGHWLAMLAKELRLLPLVPGIRARAWRRLRLAPWLRSPPAP